MGVLFNGLELDAIDDERLKPPSREVEREYAPLFRGDIHFISISLPQAALACRKYAARKRQRAISQVVIAFINEFRA